MLDAIPAYGNEYLLLLGPGIGAPAASLACEPFLAAGTRQLLLVGTCGGLSAASAPLEIGDILFANEAFTENVHSPLYGSEECYQVKRAALDEKLIRILGEERIRRGRIWSTDAPLKEGSAKASELRRVGVLGVEMETAILARQARAHEVDFVSSLVVSDVLKENSWECGFSHPVVKTSLRALAAAIGSLVSDLGEPASSKDAPSSAALI